MGKAREIDSMPISKFKATCLAALERVRRTGRPLRVTRFGKPVADVVPPAALNAEPTRLGVMRGSLRLKDDLVEPAADAHEWVVLR
jgi:antitoxin (DNA-binding transcriptional repressor) of toxin-antitoxin stability system